MAEAVVKGLRFGHVAFRVRDLEASARWYATMFGAREAFRASKDDGTPQLVYVEFAPGQFIELFPGGTRPLDPPPVPAETIRYEHYCVLVDDLQATVAHLAAHGVTPVNPPRTGRAGQQLAFVTDPDGNRIELMEIPPQSPIHRA